MAYTVIRNSVEENKYGIKANQKDIQQNKEAIADLKSNSVPYVVFESSMARLDRMNHRLIRVLIVVIILLFVSNAVWIYAWNTWDNDATTVINKDSNFIGHDGTIGGKDGD